MRKQRNANTPPADPVVPEVLVDLKEMLKQHGHADVVFIGSVENVYVFDDMTEQQKIIVHHDPIYDNGDFYFKGKAEEYFL